MSDPDQFDAFYRDARDRLLAQTYALTGDLAASRRAVRDAFVVAWHHWRKVSRLEDPESSVRPHAWRLAQRRHSARVWHREKGLDADLAALLEALGRLSAPQRRAIVLTQLAAVSMPQMAREVGLPLEAAERELQTAQSQLAMTLDVPASMLRPLFDQVTEAVAHQGGRWPRATIVRRSGATRRRAHTLVGAVAAVAVVVGSGTLLTETTGAHPTLARADRPGPRAAPGMGDAPVPVLLPESALLTADAVGSGYPDQQWTERRTHANDEGPGTIVPCQGDRYADRRGEAALVRELEADTPGRRADRPRLTQLTEVSRTDRAARRTFRVLTGWYAGCSDAATRRVQLISTWRDDRLGDESQVVVLRSWQRPVSTYVVGLARTGRFTTTTFLETRGDAVPDRDAAARVLGRAVQQLCDLPDGGGCAPSRPRLEPVPPPPTTSTPALVWEIDLPPVGGVDEPWVGGRAVRPLTNDAASRCDETSFDGRFQGARFTRGATRTFVVLDPKPALPEEFGLTETVAALPAPAAKGLVAAVRSRLADCADRLLNVDVAEVYRRDTATTSVTAWRLDIDVTDDRSITFLMAFVRQGTSVAQLGFVPAPGATMADGAFPALAERALERLAELPGPASS